MIQNKFTSSLIIVILIGIILSFGGMLATLPFTRDYYESFKLEKEGDNLFSQKQYDKAFAYYRSSKEKWSDESINNKISLSEQLYNDSAHFQSGAKAIDGNLWDDAVKELSLVSTKSDQYENATKLISYATTKLNTKENSTQVLGATTVLITPKPQQSESNAVSQKPNLEPLCKAKSEEFKTSANSKLNNEITTKRAEMRDQFHPPFETLNQLMEIQYGEYIQSTKLRIENDTSRYLTYCLTNNGDMSYFK